MAQSRRSAAARFRSAYRRIADVPGTISVMGASRTTVAAYEEGKSPIPQYIALAIGALLYGLQPAP